MGTKITILVENSVFGNLGAIAEHGWSAFIETEHGNYLFDTGQGKALLNNAKVFNKDFTSLKGIMLSHHHVDHTGGLMAAVSAAGHPIDVYAHPDLFKDSGHLRKAHYEYLGIPFSRNELESQGATFKFNTDFVQFAPNMYLTGEVPRSTSFEHGDPSMVARTQEGYIKNPIMDDQSLIIDAEEGLVIILGCSHAGIINILNYAVAKTGKKQIHTVIGGTHLGFLTEGERQKSLSALVDMDIHRIGVSHCTGFEVSAQLAKQFGDKFFYCNVGTVVEV